MTDREKVIEGLEAMREFFGFGLPSQSPVFEAYQNILTDAITLLKEQEEKIRQLESMNVSASGNGNAIGVVKGGLVIQKGQNNKHIVNNGTMTMTFGK